MNIAARLGGHYLEQMCIGLLQTVVNLSRVLEPRSLVIFKEEVYNSLMAMEFMISPISNSLLLLFLFILMLYT